MASATRRNGEIPVRAASPANDRAAVKARRVIFKVHSQIGVFTLKRATKAVRYPEIMNVAMASHNCQTWAPVPPI
jgi:hypothetical protein